MSTAVRTRGGGVAVVTALAGTVFIAAGAFWLSFTALADLARRSGVDAGQAWAWPLIVDGIIVVATVAVVALASQRSAWYPWLLLAAGALVSVTANAIHAVVAADADVACHEHGTGVAGFLPGSWDHLDCQSWDHPACRAGGSWVSSLDRRVGVAVMEVYGRGIQGGQCG